MLAAAAEATSPIKYKAAIGYDFEKVSHPTAGTSQPDGIVGYLGNGAVGVPGEESNIANNAGDRGQSYSWSAASSDGWLYVGTCYAARLVGETGAPPFVGRIMPWSCRALGAEADARRPCQTCPRGPSCGGPRFSRRPPC